MSAPVWRRGLNIPVISWSVKFHPDYPLHSLCCRPNWNRPNNMGPDVTIIGRSGKGQQGLVFEGARCDELAAVIAHNSDKYHAGFPDFEIGIQAHNDQWNFQWNPLATPSVHAFRRSRYSITLLKGHRVLLYSKRRSICLEGKEGIVGAPFEPRSHGASSRTANQEWPVGWAILQEEPV